MGKKHHKTSRQLGDLSSEQLERQALDDMAAARFRKARDAYKILCKQDREKYLPGLVEANRRLAEQLMGNGLVSEAEQVLTYLKTIAPPSSILATDVSVALKKQDWQKALEAALHFARKPRAYLLPKRQTWWQWWVRCVACPKSGGSKHRNYSGRYRAVRRLRLGKFW